MKPDKDACWQEGRDAFCAENFPDYPRCSWEYERCVECLDDGDCTSFEPHCTWDKKCVECEVDAQCPGEEICDPDGFCKLKNCVDYANEGFPNYCRDVEPETPVCDFDLEICVECVNPSDCEIGETCIGGVCTEEGEKDCVDKENEGVYDYCSKLYPARPICHSHLRECVECQFVSHCGDDEDCVATRCLRNDWECEGPEDCMSDRWKCVNHECVLKVCIDYDDPDAFCDEKYPGWRCRDDGVCVKCIEDEHCPDDKKCDNYKCWAKVCSDDNRPDWWCGEKYNDYRYKCIGDSCVFFECEIEDDCDVGYRCDDDHRCVEKLCSDYPEPDMHCALEYGEGYICHENECVECVIEDDCDPGYYCTPDKSCARKTCDKYDDPDAHCALKYGVGYTCENKECVSAGCAWVDANCPKGYYCQGDECIWGCRNPDNCPEQMPYCSTVTGECEECLGPVHCGPGYDCIDHKCVQGSDCNHTDSLCPENEYCNIHVCEPGCRDSRNCGDWTPHCSRATGMCEECVYDLHCEPGHDCSDSYKCIWVGYGCYVDPDCPVNWMCHLKECIFGCKDSDNCSDHKPHCSQRTGECEECWSPMHCEWWQDCDNYVCVAKHGHDECVEGDVKHGYRCRDGVWVKMECHGPEDCLGHESCINGLCVDNERECEDVDDCIAGYFCDVDRSHTCKPQVCMDHSECGPGNCCGAIASWSSSEKGCEDCSTYPCKLWGPCPPGWICDSGTGLCREAMCEWPFECGDPKYFDCIYGLCVALSCEDADDPLEWCRQERGWYYRCLDGNCILLDCDAYSDPDMMCIDMHGDGWRCEGNRCLDRGPGGTEDPDKYCVDLLGIDEAFWNYDTEKCDVPDCDTVQDPDGLCAQLKDDRYKCRDGECRRGREGEECENYDECVPSLGCKEGICTKYECYRPRDCEDDEWCVEHMCIPMNTTCEGDHECRDDYHCDPNGICVPDICYDHYGCGLGYCCNESGVCIPCGELTCFGSFDCRQGWRCSPSTGKCERTGCQRDVDCDIGYWCDISDGECKKLELDYDVCWFNWDCPSGQVCKGQYVEMLWPQYQLIPDLAWGQGICVDEDARLVQIEGVDDKDTCDYCKEMWKKVGREGEFKLPPYHEHCRCYAVYI